MAKWRKETLERIDAKVEDEVAAHERYIAQAKKAGETAKLIVEKTDMRFDYPHIEAIGGEIKIYWNKEASTSLSKDVSCQNQRHNP